MIVAEEGELSAALSRHPCISAAAFGKSGRIHLPVSPICNIQCRFCPRKLHPTAVAPGVTQAILTPGQAAQRVDIARAHCSELAVAGIAGPGDPLASDHAERTLALVHARHPDLLLCVSTNGLELPARAKALCRLGVRSITVTMNATDPATLSQIVSHIALGRVVVHGHEAAEILIARQRLGIAEAASLGAFVKINFVLVPEVNADQVGEVARAGSALGAKRINIIPLLPQGEFAGHRPPTCSEVEQARRAAERYLPVFRHCQHCRADACGIPGATAMEAELFGSSREATETFSHG